MCNCILGLDQVGLSGGAIILSLWVAFYKSVLVEGVDRQRTVSSKRLECY